MHIITNLIYGKGALQYKRGVGGSLVLGCTVVYPYGKIARLDLFLTQTPTSVLRGWPV